MKRIILLLLLLIPTVSATWYYNSEEIYVNLDISSQAQLIKKSDNARLEYVDINLSFVPYESYDQEILSLTTTPKATISQDSALFHWDNPTKDIEFSLNSQIYKQNKRIKVRNKVNFPVTGIIQTEYISPSETIDSDNQEIFELANELAAGETDLFQVTFNLATWVNHNIEYSLSSLTADVSQKSSWVIQTRQGVCDELTNLFIALARSLGIPARFISGIAYTNSPDFPEEWGAHGWAEVFFPGYGWIPYDVTYGEYGFVDPTHIKLKVGLDANEPATKFKWFGYNTDINTAPLDIKTTLNSYSGERLEPILIQTKPFAKQIGFGSHNIIEVTIKNLADYYLATELYLSKPIEISVIGDKSLPVFLKPKEEKTVFFTIKLNGNLDRNFIYFFPFRTYTTTNQSSNSVFNATSTGTELTLNEINAVIDQKQESEKVFTTDLALVCTPEKKEFYDYEKVNANCNIRNNGNVLLRNLDLCLNTDCKNFDLGISESDQLTFALSKTKNIATITAKNNQVSKTSIIEYNVLDMPEIVITEIKNPESVSYNDNYKLSFIVKKESRSIPQNINIKLDSGLIKEWTISELTIDKKFDITLSANELSVGPNRFKITVNYNDKNYKKYSIEEQFEINLNKPTLPQRIKIFFNDIGKFITRLFT